VKLGCLQGVTSGTIEGGYLKKHYLNITGRRNKHRIQEYGTIIEARRYE
jgi:hypothetical protein